MFVFAWDYNVRLETLLNSACVSNLHFNLFHHNMLDFLGDKVLLELGSLHSSLILCVLSTAESRATIWHQ